MALDKGTGRKQRKSRRKEPPKGTRVDGPEPLSYEDARSTVAAIRATRAATQTVRPAPAAPSKGVRNRRNYEGERPVAVGKGGAFYDKRPGPERSADDVQGDHLQKLLQPALDRTPKLAKGVRTAEAVGESFLPLSLLDRVEGKDLAGGTLAVDALLSIPFLRGGRAAKKAVDALDDAPRPAGADKIIESLPEAKRLRRKQAAGYRAERGKRAAKAEQAAEIGGEEGYRAALAELKGELPKLKFGALEDFDQQAADELFTHVQKSGLRPYEKISTQTALRKVIDGGVPTKSEIRLLDKAFGPDVAGRIADSVPFWAKAKTVGLELINVPRSLRASYDLSAPFRQMLVLGARHPKMFAGEMKPMVRAAFSEKYYQNMMDELASRPTFALGQKAKLQMTDLGGLATREEQFMSNYAERIPIIGRGVRASSRGYVGVLNKFRHDAFDNYLEIAESQGLDIDDPQLLKSVASWVNHGTGRGTVKALEGAMVPLNALFFSPRLIASRLQLLNPTYYAQLHPFARKQALRGMAQLLGGISLTLWIAKMSGEAEVGVDPRSADFGKIKVGDTRVDIAGGLQQYIVAASRLVKGETVSSTTGEVTTLEGGFAKPSRADILMNFGENKLAPVPAWLADLAKNENFAGDEFDPLKEGGRSFLPLGLENAYEGFAIGGPGPGVVSATLGSIGFGVQTYKPKPSKSATRDREEGLAQIDAMLKRGEISPEDAAEFRGMIEDAYQQKVDESQIGKTKLERLQMVEGAVEAGIPREELNDILAQSDKEPFTAEEWDELEREALRLDVQVGK